MTRLSNSFEGGTDGAAITTGNSGGASGDAFDDVTAGGVGTITYNAANAVFGGMAAAINPATSATAYLGYNSLGTITSVWGRTYVKFPVLPTSNQVLVMIRDSVTPAQCAALVVLTDGRIRLDDAVSTVLATSTSVLTATSQARLEWRVVGHATSGVVELKIFLSPQSTTPTETITATSANTRGSFDRFRIGQNAGAATDLGVFYLEEVAWDTVAYIGPASFTVAPTGLLDATATLYTPSVTRNIVPALLDATATLFTPNVRRGVNVELLDATATLFTPKANLKVTAGGAFQINAFQNNTFQVDTGLFVDQSGALFTPSLTAALPTQTITVPGPSGISFQPDAFQNDTFQATGGMDQSPVLFTPNSITLGSLNVFPGLLDQSGVLFAPSVAGNFVVPALLDATATLYEPTLPSSTQFILLDNVGVWDSPTIVWDSTTEVWDGSSGVVDQSPVLFTPSVKLNVTVGLIDQSGVLFAPTVSPKGVGVPLLDASGFVFTPETRLLVTVALLDASPVVYQFSFPGLITPDLLDATAELYTPNVNPNAILVDLLDGSGFVITPEVRLKVTVGLIDQSPTVFTPSLGQFQVPLLDASGVLFSPSLTPVLPALLDASGVVFTPQQVVKPFVQTVRLDDTTDGLVDATATLFTPDIVLALPKTIFIELLDASGQLLDLRIIVPTRPTIVLRARYDPVSVKHARYDPIVLKHAQNSRQG